jgi:hypothetical protein
MTIDDEHDLHHIARASEELRRATFDLLTASAGIEEAERRRAFWFHLRQAVLELEPITEREPAEPTASPA